MTALLGLLRKEAYHILRDRRTLTVLLLLPIIQVVIFGYAIRTDVENVRMVIVDPSPDYLTTELRNRLSAGHAFRIVAVVPNTTPLEMFFQTGRAQAALVFEPRFAERRRMLLITDATEPNTAATIQAYVFNVWGAGDLARAAWAGSPAPHALQIVPQARLRFNPTAESKNLFVPGLMTFVLTIISSLMTAITLTREKESGTMEALLVSPLRPWQIIVGKVTPYLLIGLISIIGVVLGARLIFHVPLHGSVLLLIAEGMVFILVSLALGVLISAKSSTQRVAMTAALIGTMLPTMILSGFIFPIESMPQPLQWLSNVVPATWFIIIARGIMLKGTGLEYLWQESLILAAMAVVLLVISTRSFHERLES